MSVKGRRWALAGIALVAIAAAAFLSLGSGAPNAPDAGMSRDDETGATGGAPALVGRSEAPTPAGTPEPVPAGPSSGAAQPGVSVLVLDRTARPVAGASVEAIRRDRPLAERPPLSPESRATTGDDGRVLLRLPPGVGWVVAASAPGLSRAAVRIDRLVPSALPLAIVLHLGPGHVLEGRVLDADARPVAGAEILVTVGDPSRPPEQEVRGRSDGEGVYALDRLPGGDLDLFVRRAGGTLRPAGRVRLPFSGRHDIRLVDGARLSGRVVGPDRQPVGDALVRLHLMAQGVLETRTDASGAYLFEDVPGNDRWNFLSAEAHGLVVAPDQRGYLLVGGGVGACVRLDPMRPGDRREQDLLLRGGAQVTGRILGPRGPLPGARVQAHVGTDDTGYATLGTTSDDAGEYAFEALPEGRVFLTASDGDHVLPLPTLHVRRRMARESGDPGPWTVVRAGERAVVDIHLVSAASALGTILSAADTPIPGASVWVGPAVPEEHTPRAVSDAAGRFRLEGLVPGVATHAWAARDGYAPGGATEFTPATGDEIVLRLQAFRSIRGRVRALDGPVPPGTVVKGAAGGRGVAPVDAWGRFQRAAAAPVREDGTFEVEVPVLTGAAGEAWILALAPGYAPTRAAPVTLVPDREPSEVEVVLQRGDALVVRVTAGDSGAPLEGASLTLTSNAEDSVVEVWQGAQPVSDERGEILIEGLVRGSHTAVVAAPGYVSLWLRWGREAPTRLEAPLPRALAIDGVVLGPDGASPVAAALVEAEPIGTPPRPPAGPLSDRTRGRATTSMNGTFRLAGLAAGRYRVKASPPRHGPSLATTTVEADAGAAAVRIVLEAAGRLAGVVLGPDGTPLRGLEIRVRPDGEPRSSRVDLVATTGPDGAWSVSGLTAARLSVQVVAPLWGKGEELVGEERTGVASGTEDLRITLREGLTIEGIVLRPDGEPAVGLPLGTGSKRTVTQEGGAFVLRGLETGEHRLFVHGWANPTGLFRLDGAERVPAGSRSLRLYAKP